METIKLKVSDIQINKDGNLVIITPASKHNDKGAFVMNEAQTEAILRRAGVPSVYGLKHVNSLSNGTSSLTFEALLCKAGDTFTKKDGSTGTYGDKDWTKLSNFQIDLGFASKMKLAELSLQAAFSTPHIQPRKVEVPVVAAIEEKSNDEAPGV